MIETKKKEGNVPNVLCLDPRSIKKKKRLLDSLKGSACVQPTLIFETNIDFWGRGGQQDQGEKRGCAKREMRQMCRIRIPDRSNGSIGGRVWCQQLPAPRAYNNVAAFKKPVVGFEDIACGGCPWFYRGVKRPHRGGVLSFAGNGDLVRGFRPVGFCQH